MKLEASLAKIGELILALSWSRNFCIVQRSTYCADYEELLESESEPESESEFDRLESSSLALDEALDDESSVQTRVSSFSRANNTVCMSVRTWILPSSFLRSFVTALPNAHLLFHLCSIGHYSHAASLTLSSLAFLRHESLAFVTSLIVAAVAVIEFIDCFRAIEGRGVRAILLLLFYLSFDLFGCIAGSVIQPDVVWILWGVFGRNIRARGFARDIRCDRLGFVWRSLRVRARQTTQ